MSRPSAYIGPKRPERWRELLVAMRDGRITPPKTSEDLASLLEEAERNELGPHVAHALMRAGDDRQVVADLHQRAQDRIEVMLAAADDVASILADAGIPTLALKNVGIARAIYPCAACTPMGDIDLLVPRSDFREAHELLVNHGLKHDTRAPGVEPADLEHGYESGGCEYRYGSGTDEVWVELQWRPVSGRWIRPHQEPVADELVERSRPIGGSALRLLDATDNLLQVALHTAKHSYCRAPGLRLHTDVHRLATFDPPDWDQITNQAAGLDVRTATFFSFDIPASLLGTSIPQDVLDRLWPSGGRQVVVQKMLQRASIFEPRESKFNRAEMILFHASLYDTLGLLAASAANVEPQDLRASNAVQLAGKAARRVNDLMTRYQP